MDSPRIEVISTDIADLSMQGFGSVSNCQSVCDALCRMNYNASVCVIRSPADLISLEARKPDLVVAGIKYVVFGSEEIYKSSPGKVWIAQYLHDLDIQYTGSDHLAIEMEFDKGQAKALLLARGLATADFFVALPGDYDDGKDLPLPYPLFIKPLYESDSRGIDARSAVFNHSQYLWKIAQIALDFHQPSLVETYLPGREFTVAILAAGQHSQLGIYPTEIVIESRRAQHFLEFSAKQANLEKLIPIADQPIMHHVSELAKNAFLALGGRDFGRIDLKMDARGRLFFLEANLLPGMHPQHSYFPQACRMLAGMEYDELVRQMIRPAMQRFGNADKSGRLFSSAALT